MATIGDAHEVEQEDLRGGNPPWGNGRSGPQRHRLTESFKVDVLVVGGGITGSLTAQNLAACGMEVALIDRERPGLGSTAASTAMLQWEIDRPLADLATFYGFDMAAAVYRHSLSAVAGLSRLVSHLGIDCAFRPRSTLYVAAGDVGPDTLLCEHALRQRAGLPGLFMERDALFDRYGIDRAGAIVSPGSADADPLLLSWGLLADAAQRGVRLIDAFATHYHAMPKAVVVETDSGFVIEARHVILATGYVMPDFVQCPLHEMVSSWAVATVPQAPEDIWPDGALIWEASDSYHYARTTVGGRIIIGGEDEAVFDQEARDALSQEKSALLVDTLSDLWPKATPLIDHSWSGAFGETADGLPLIGPVPGMPRIFAAYGYGGNGITFSFMASRILAALCAGDNRAEYEMFALDRPSPAR